MGQSNQYANLNYNNYNYGQNSQGCVMTYVASYSEQYGQANYYGCQQTSVTSTAAEIIGIICLFCVGCCCYIAKEAFFEWLNQCEGGEVDEEYYANSIFPRPVAAAPHMEPLRP